MASPFHPCFKRKEVDLHLATAEDLIKDIFTIGRIEDCAKDDGKEFLPRYIGF